MLDRSSRPSPSRTTLRWLRVAVALAGCFLGLALATPAQGWGGAGHRWLTTGAIPHLPLPLRGFFAANQSAIVTQAGNEPPGAHYIDIDYYPEFLAGTFPRNLNVLIAKYGSSAVNSNGKGPWTYADYVSSLSAGMAAAHTPSDWQNLIPTAAAMAHYIEDLHNPLHLTLNYDGQLSGNNGIHSRYESSMIQRHFADLAIAPANAVYLPSVIDFVFDGIDDRYHYVDDIMVADDLAPGTSGTAYYDVLWAETGDFTYDLFQDASLAVASSWYTAWINAGSPRTFLAHSADFEADGDVDRFDLTVWRNEFGVSAVADANGDGRTDGDDFLLWQRQLGAGAAMPAGESVPEPACSALLTSAMIAAWSWRFSLRRTRRPRGQS